MKYKPVVFIISLCLVWSCVSDKKEDLAADKYLLIPGKSAEGYSIGNQVVKNSSMIEMRESKNISDILNIDILSDLKFDSVLYVKDSFALFLKDNTVVAIAGFKTTRRVTSDAVLLSRGIDNFILNYGNTGLSIITKGNHKVYIYKESGIAVFDDKSDNTIDMFLIFK
jgi:hypothetical protein